MLKHSDGSSAISGLMPGKDGKLPKMADKPMDKPADLPMASDGHSELHDNHDGTFCTVTDGVKSEPMSLEEATEHLKMHHGGGEMSEDQPSEAQDHEGLSGFGG